MSFCFINFFLLFNKIYFYIFFFPEISKNIFTNCETVCLVNNIKVSVSIVILNDSMISKNILQVITVVLFQCGWPVIGLTSITNVADNESWGTKS